MLLQEERKSRGAANAKYVSGLLSVCGDIQIIICWFAKRVQRGCTLGNIKVIIRTPVPIGTGVLLLSSADWPRCRVAPIPSGGAPRRVLPRVVDRHCSSEHPPVQPGVGQQTVATIVRFLYAKYKCMKARLLVNAQTGILSSVFSTAPRGCPTAKDYWGDQTHRRMGIWGTSRQASCNGSAGLKMKERRQMLFSPRSLELPGLEKAIFSFSKLSLLLRLFWLFSLLA